MCKKGNRLARSATPLGFLLQALVVLRFALSCVVIWLAAVRWGYRAALWARLFSAGGCIVLAWGLRLWPSIGWPPFSRVTFFAMDLGSGSEDSPPPPPELEAFRSLVAAAGKR